MKLWDKGYSTDKKIDHFTVGNDRELDLVLAKYDVIASMAHAKMLGKIGLLTSEETLVLVRELENIGQSIKEGTFIIEDTFEDVHSKIEFLLIVLTESNPHGQCCFSSGRGRCRLRDSLFRTRDTKLVTFNITSYTV